MRIPQRSRTDWALVLIALVILSCGRGGNSGASPPPAQTPPPAGDGGNTPKDTPAPDLPLVVEPTKESIQKHFVDVSCLSCHQPATRENRYVDLTDISLLAQEGHVHELGAARHNLIRGGCPKQSFFLSIIRQGKMPPPPQARPADETLKAIEDWIASLRPDASCDSDEPGEDDEDGL